MTDFFKTDLSGVAEAKTEYIFTLFDFSLNLYSKFQIILPIKIKC